MTVITIDWDEFRRGAVTAEERGRRLADALLKTLLEQHSLARAQSRRTVFLGLGSHVLAR